MHCCYSLRFQYTSIVALLTHSHLHSTTGSGAPTQVPPAKRTKTSKKGHVACPIESKCPGGSILQPRRRLPSCHTKPQKICCWCTTHTPYVRPTALLLSPCSAHVLYILEHDCCRPAVSCCLRLPRSLSWPNICVYSSVSMTFHCRAALARLREPSNFAPPPAPAPYFLCRLLPSLNQIQRTSRRSSWGRRTS